VGLYHERDLTKLPLWAQDYFADIRRQRDVAVSALNEFQDAQTPTRIWVDEHVCTGEEQGPSIKKHYVQSRHLTIKVGKDELYLYLREDDELDISTNFGRLAIHPIAGNAIKIREPKR
jgi:hypothetical protein